MQALNGRVSPLSVLSTRLQPNLWPLQRVINPDAHAPSVPAARALALVALSTLRVLMYPPVLSPPSPCTTPAPVCYLTLHIIRLPAVETQATQLAAKMRERAQALRKHGDVVIAKMTKQVGGAGCRSHT